MEHATSRRYDVPRLRCNATRHTSHSSTPSCHCASREHYMCTRLTPLQLTNNRLHNQTSETNFNGINENIKPPTSVETHCRSIARHTPKTTTHGIVGTFRCVPAQCKDHSNNTRFNNAFEIARWCNFHNDEEFEKLKSKSKLAIMTYTHHTSLATRH